jgi:hypothetical protein
MKNNRLFKLSGRIIVLKTQPLSSLKMKKAFVAVLLLFIARDGFSQVGIGMGGGGFGMGMRIPLGHKQQQTEDMDSQVQRMKKDLNLDSTQVLELRSLLVEHDRRSSNKETMSKEEFNSRMDAILTPQQKERFRELRSQNKHNGQQHSAPYAKDSTATKKPAPDAGPDDILK